MSHSSIQLPSKLRPLFDPMRYKVLWGGRGSGKSWGVAIALLVIASQKPTRVLCARELQNSLDESVHKLLSDQIVAMGLSSFYTVLRDCIRGINGSEFIFEGLRHNTPKIKSMEGVDICWVEEAEKVTETSWSTLVPTIRKEGSEIWATFNPNHPDDATWQRFVAHPQPDSWVVNVNWSDNPWFPDVLRREMEHLKATDFEEAEFIWEGKFRQFTDGSIYKKEIIEARRDGRTNLSVYDVALPVITAWDLGVGDATVIWFAQIHRNEVRLIDYYEQSGEGLPHYAKVLADKGYLYGDHWAPHDIAVRELGSGLSRLEVARSLGINFRIAPRQSLEDGIHAVRLTLPRMWFDKKVEKAVTSLSMYRRELNNSTGEYRSTPVHDGHSHCADGLRYLCLSIREQGTVSGPLRRGLKMV